MADTLLLHYDPANPDRATWSHVNHEGELTSRITSGTLADAAIVAEQHKVVVLIDSTNVHLNHVKLPTSNRQKMLRAVPFALEDQIAEDVEQFHFVIGKSESDYGVPVAGIPKDAIETLLTKFSEADIVVDAIIPDAICSPIADNQWTIVFHGDKALVQFDAQIGTVIDTINLPLLLETSLHEAETKPEKITYYYLEDQEPQLDLDQIDANIETIKIAYNTHPLVIFCGVYNKVRSLNLLQDKYKPKRKTTGQWYRWRLAASLAAVWLLLYLGTALFEINRLEKKNDALRVEIDNIYKKTFPASKRVINARVQMEQKLNELKGGGSTGGSQFLSLLKDSAAIISSQKEIQIQSIDFRNNTMNIGLTASRLQSVETLNKQLNTSNKIQAEILSATSEKNRVNGSIRMQRSGA
ncbi:MAG: type II secretion system protein GspL [Gammaproteobacteria bacterium]